MDIIVVQNNKNKCGIICILKTLAVSFIAIDQPFHLDDSFDMLLKL